MPQAQYINGWGGGLNKLLPAKDIADNELADSLNMELTNSLGLRKRDGTSLADDPSALTDVTGLVRYMRSNGENHLVFAEGGSTLYRSVPTTAGSHSFVDVTGGLTLSASSLWQWAIMDDKLWGVNGVAGGAQENHIVINGHAANAAAPVETAGTFPDGKFITTFARRLWIVDQAEPNKLHFSALGDGLNWDTSAGGANAGSVVVGQDEGDYITGIKPFLGRLIIFKRSRIYMLVPGSPNTDSLQFNMVLLTDRLGCVDGATIQQVLNDVIFLSDYGVSSVAAAQEFGDLKQAVISQKLPEMAGLSDSSVYASAVLPSRNQYWLSDYTNNKVYVLDFSQATAGGGMSWAIFDGDVAGQSYATCLYQGESVLYIGNSDLVIYDATQFDDQDTTNTGNAFFRTKAYVMGEPLRRKDFSKFGVEFEAESDPVNFNITYRLDQDGSRQKTVAGSFSSLITGSVLGGPHLLGTTFKLATGVSENTDIIWPIRGDKGRRAQSIQFRFDHSQADQGFKVKRMMIVFDYVRNLWNVGDYDGS